ncbi:hypothetical protein E4K10_01115 [Streptomyces sp. T1317-0309]|nr:hypothetical protein E4K10_01115 [Streptomyces sp. T1317-0309]
MVGAALAVLAFLLWPTWSTRTLPGLLAEWLRVQDRLLPQLLTGYADVGATDLAALDTLRARSRQVREHLNAAAKQSHAEPAEHRALADCPDGSDHHRGVQGRRVRHAAARTSAAYCAGHGARAHRAGRPAARTPRCPRSRRPPRRWLRGLSSATVDALEALTATVVSGHRHGVMRRPEAARRPRG